jgi:histidinol-phosphate aminotransferase
MTSTRTAAIDRYAPDETPVAIDLADNTNRWGSPPAALRVLRDTAPGAIARYPDAYSTSLKAALAAYTGVEASAIAIGCGSDDLLDAALRAFADPGDRIAIPVPTFSMMTTFARLNALEPALIPLDASFDVDVDAVVAARPRLVYLCSPNNPTGTLLPRATIEAVLERTGAVVILDEAYAEFSGVSAIDLVARSPRLLVARTLSKAFGMAGLRVGYAVGAPTLVRELEKARGPYKVSAASERAAVAAVTEDLGWMRAHAELAVGNRERLAVEMRRRDVDVISSAANFLLAPVADAHTFARRLRAIGVAVRAFSGLDGTALALAATRGSALRITVGPWPEMESLLAAFDRVRAACE